MMPVIEQYARYISPAYYDEVLTVRTYINEMPNARIKFEYEIIRKESTSQPIICSGHNSLAFVDIKSGKPLRCPKLIIEALSLSND
jgi:acyl-CoA thioester hydrolase